jgi:hypothetical protein
MSLLGRETLTINLNRPKRQDNSFARDKRNKKKRESIDSNAILVIGK